MPSVITLRGPVVDTAVHVVSTQLQTVDLPVAGQLSTADADKIAASLVASVKRIVAGGTLIGLALTITFSSLAIGTYKARRHP